MKTTVEISTPLLAEAKAAAARAGTTLRALIEQGLRRVLQEQAVGRERFVLADRSVGGEGLTPEFEAKGGWSRLREAAYPGFFDDDDDDGDSD